MDGREAWLVGLAWWGVYVRLALFVWGNGLRFCKLSIVSGMGWGTGGRRYVRVRVCV